VTEAKTDRKKILWHIAQKSGLDTHVLGTLLFRAWTVFAGFLTILVVPHWLSATEQGFYFTFSSLIALQVFFELGSTYVITQYSARQLSQLDVQGKVIGGEPEAIARLARLLWLASRIYCLLGLIFLASVASLGTWFFSGSSSAPPHWAFAWWLAVAATAGNLIVSPWLAAAEGLGRVGDVARLRTVQSIIGYGLAWSLMVTGHGLFSLASIAGAAMLGTIFWIVYHAKDLLRLARSGDREEVRSALSWKKDILPFQWRIAVSWASGYLIFQLFTPITFYLHGPEVAGKIGLALAITNALTTLAMSWVNAKSPEITRFLAKRDTNGAKELFKRQFKTSTVAHAFAMLALLGASSLSDWLGWVMSERLPSNLIILAIVLASVCSQLVFAMAVYVRAHGVEALMWPTIWTGIATLATTVALSPIGPTAAMFGYTGVQALVCLPWVAWIFVRRFWFCSPKVIHVM
jgi:O-antigen/teichoic acid export membrane protein